MRGAIAVGCVLLAGGCDAVLRLQSFPDPRDASGDGAADAGDAPVSSCGTLSTFTGAGTPTLMATRMTEATLEDPSPRFLVFSQGPDLEYDDFVGSPTSAIPNAVHPALSRDGSSLYFYSTASGMVEVVQTAQPGVFSSPTGVSSLANVRPAPVVITNGGELRMVAFEPASSEFIELESSSPTGMWTQFGPTLQPGVIGVDGSIFSPSLSADGLVLAFVHTAGARPPGVYYVRRPSTLASFAVHSDDGVLLATANPVTSPWLTADCKSLYLVDTTSTTLFRYDQ